MVEVVVQNGDERRIEGEVLLERARALHLQRNTCHAVSEEDVSAVGFFRLGAPLVADGRAIGPHRQCTGDFAWTALGWLDFCGAFGDPSAAGWRNFKFFVADGLSSELDGELALVLSKEYAAGRLPALLSGERQRGAGHDSEC